MFGRFSLRRFSSVSLASKLNNEASQVVVVPHIASKLAVVYEDNHLLVLNKPCGLAMNPSSSPSSSSSSLSSPSIITKGNMNLLDMAKSYVVESQQKEGNAFLAPVHFLDKCVSGIVITAKTTKAASRVSEFFRNRDVNLKKQYLCVVHGRGQGRGQIIPTDSFFDNDYSGSRKVHLIHTLRPLSYDDNKNTRRRVECLEYSSGGGGITAELNYESLLSFSTPELGDLSLLRVELVTGRKHQIRAQMAYIGMPIVGDSQYKSILKKGSNDDGKISNQIALHAYRLEMKYPVPTLNKPNKLCLSVRPPAFWNRLIRSNELQTTIDHLFLVDDVQEQKSISISSLDEKILQLADQRSFLRKNRQWRQADKIRDKLFKQGFLIKDGNDAFGDRDWLLYYNDKE